MLTWDRRYSTPLFIATLLLPGNSSECPVVVLTPMEHPLYCGFFTYPTTTQILNFAALDTLLYSNAYSVSLSPILNRNEGGEL